MQNYRTQLWNNVRNSKDIAVLKQEHCCSAQWKLSLLGTLSAMGKWIASPMTNQSVWGQWHQELKELKVRTLCPRYPWQVTGHSLTFPGLLATRVVKCFKVICSCLEPGLLISIASGESFCAESDKLGFISSWYMSAFFLLSLLTLNIHLQKWIKHENALVTPMIRVSTHGELNVITTTRDNDLHAARQTVYPLYPKENLFPSSNKWH